VVVSLTTIDARGLRTDVDPLPDLQDEQAELLAHWLGERGYHVVSDAEESVVPEAHDPYPRDYLARLESLRMAVEFGRNLEAAEAYRKFLMGEAAE
jgi:hypothetical protein